MHLHRSGIVLLGIATASLLAASACTALLDRETKQCSTEGDCKRYSASAVCRDNVCQELGQADAGLGPPGCFTGTPTNDLEFYNQCTTAEHVKFDNCARIGLCDDKYDPAALTEPPDAGNDPPSDGGTNPPGARCYDAAERPKVIYMQGSTNFTPFIQAMAPLVASRGYTIVWQPTSSCAGAAAAGFDTPGRTVMRNPTTASQSFASYYDSAGNGTPCVLGHGPNSPEPGAGETTDIGESDVFAASCGNPGWIPGSAAYGNIGHSLGPIQAMVFVTPPASTQRAISAEAAHMVFGMGGKGGTAAPWVDPNFLWVRSATTGTNNIISRGIDVPPARWWGVDKKTGPGMRDGILTASADVAEKTIGTLSIDLADGVKTGLHILFYQARGQLEGFLPDSTRAANDKKNVRDGHYPLWGPIHLYTKFQNGQPTPAAAAFLLPFAVPNQTLLDATIAGGFVPLCAMSVSRDTEMGPIKSTTPAFQCHCAYESKVGGGAPKDCRTCSGPADCTPDAPACNIGFCEKQ